MNAEFFVARWHSPEGCFMAVVKRGRALLHLVTQGYPVRLDSLPIKDERSLTPVDYPIKRAARKMLEFGKHDNITSGARKLLQEATSAPTG